jgi:hypothetical protein
MSFLFALSQNPLRCPTVVKQWNSTDVDVEECCDDDEVLSDDTAESWASAYDAAWEQGDLLSDWDDDSDHGNQPPFSPEGFAEWNDALYVNEESRLDREAFYRLRKPGLIHSTAGDMSPPLPSEVHLQRAALQYPEVPLPGCQSHEAFQDHLLAGDLVYDLHSHLDLSGDIYCYREVAVAQQCLEILLV